ncbi:major capsid protein [Vibrio phage 1.139.A._10N.261.48.C6]|nr:major capsid protein [Vibrio phage 1.034.O._10N.261.46.B7]AUR83444.1 major capsid protein [Vibrio phage 1.034.X._10N.261.46.B7]AUR90182.1 major capsid protein [Vibrio phage 1.139.A._10N.261.48.C6]AUR90249.1 major capsid protein [Vibrio phage 1.139.B._10N.261.48.C6]AUR95571.1 major capsid protein [Vibrio phage 1.209.O._10N.222.52.B2]
MSGNHTGNTESLIRSEIWQDQLEEILYEQLLKMPIVRQVDFPDGKELTMPSVSTPVVRNLPELSEVTYDALDTGEVSIKLNDPVVVANSLSRVLMEDSMWANEVMAMLPSEQAQAIMERIETDIFALANQQFGGANNANLINGVAHRRIAKGTNETMAPEDFAFAAYSLKKAKIPTSNLIAIVDPSVAFALETSTNLVNVSNNPRWEGIIETGISDNFRFVRNVFGFDIFESNLLADMNETIDGRTTTAGKANIFMSLARPTINPFVMAWKREASLESEWNKDLQQHEILTTARYGSGLVRDENLVVIGSDTDQVN